MMSTVAFLFYVILSGSLEAKYQNRMVKNNRVFISLVFDRFTDNLALTY